MALFKILQGPDVKLHGDAETNTPAQDLHEGYCYFTTDNNMFYVDYRKNMDDENSLLLRSPLNANSSYFLYNPDKQEASLKNSLEGWSKINIPTNYAIYDHFFDETKGVMHLKMDKANPNGTGSLGLNIPEGVTMGENAVALNSGNKATGKNTFCAGEGTVSTATGQFAIGKFNELDTWYPFVVGGGEDDEHRKNLFFIDWSGNAVLENTLIISDPTGEMLEQDAYRNKENSFAATRGYVKEMVGQAVRLIIIE